MTHGERVALLERLGHQAAVAVGQDLPLDLARLLERDAWHGTSVLSLLAVQLDDQLFRHRDLNVLAQRQAPHEALALVGIDLEPLRELAAAGVEVVVHAGGVLGVGPELDDVAHLHQERRHRDLAPVHGDVAVGHHLPALAPGRGEAEAMDDVVQAQLEQPQEVLAGHALLALGPVEVLPELALEHAVDALGLLLLAELHAEGGELAAVEAVLPGRVVAALDGALVGEAAGALEEELYALAAAETALRVAVARHGCPLHPPPLRRPAAVVRDGGDVANRGDLET